MRYLGAVEYQHVCIEAVSYVVPETEVTTADLEQRLAPLYRRLGMAPGYLDAITGIRARRFWEPGVQPSDVATRAADRALADAKIDRGRVDVLVSTSVCKDFIEPSVASLVHGNLGLKPHCLNFDVGNACLGFLTGMLTVANMIELGQVEAGIVVAGEGSRTVTESTVRVLQDPTVTVQAYRDNLATLTLGSGAAAMVLTHERVAKVGHRLLGGLLRAATEHSRLCVGTETSMTTGRGCWRKACAWPARPGTRRSRSSTSTRGTSPSTRSTRSGRRTTKPSCARWRFPTSARSACTRSSATSARPACRSRSPRRSSRVACRTGIWSR